MPIKKSLLEQKWYYRLLKVCYLIFPIAVALFLFLDGKISVFDISQKNILDLAQENIIYIIYIVIGLVLYYGGIPKLFLYLLFGGLEDDTKPSGSVAPPAAANKTGLISILIIIGVIVVFALLENGYLPFINGAESHTYGSPCTGSNKENGLYGTNGHCYTCSTGIAVTNPQGTCSDAIFGVYCCVIGDNSNSNSSNSNNNDGCIATGCGSMWYCSGSYYVGGQQINVPGLCFPIHPRDVYPSWSGTCRQCP